MKDSVIILSGGMDSVTLLYDMADTIKYAISFDYGANHNKEEIEYARFHCKKMNIEHIIMDIRFIQRYFAGNLLTGAGNVKNGDSIDSKKDSVVPFRNGIMLSIACGFAESNNCKTILIANHKGKEIALPDCSRDFIESMNNAMINGTYSHVNIVAPYTDLFKYEIILKGKKMNLDFVKTYSCYKGGKKHCGMCPACIERKEALFQANINDLTDYEF